MAHIAKQYKWLLLDKMKAGKPFMADRLSHPILHTDTLLLTDDLHLKCIGLQFTTSDYQLPAYNRIK